MKRISKKQLLLAAVLFASALLLLLLLRPAPFPVEAARVIRGPLQLAVEAEGMTRVADRYTVASPVSGRLLRIGLEAGDPVVPGTILASIVPPQLDAREYREASALAGSASAELSAAEARRRQASANLAQSRLRSARYDNLYREGAVSKEGWEIARTQAEVLEKEERAAISAVSAASFRYEAARSRFDRHLAMKPVEVAAPAAGRVLRVYEQSERTVAAGAPLFDIGDPATLEIVIDVISSDAVSVRTGQPVSIEGWGGGSIIKARVSRVEPAAFTKTSALGIEEKRVNIIALPERTDPRLGDNYRVLASIVVREAPEALKVPSSTLFRRGSSWRLFVIDRGRAVERQVRIGLRGAFETEVLGGVRVGQQVILHPQNELKEGMRVKVQER